MSWSVTLPIKPKSYNVYLRQHWTTRKKYHEKVHLLLLAHASSKEPIKGPVIVHYTEWFAGRWKDITNLYGSFKPIEDCIVRLGIIEDDTPDIVTEIFAAQHRVKTKKEQRVEIRIERVVK